MPERHPSLNGPEEFESVASQEEYAVPSPEELAAFEEWREARAFRPPLRVEQFAKDPDNPTEWEVAAVDEINEYRYSPYDTFERYFGYPDPRRTDPFEQLKEDLSWFEQRYEWWRYPQNIRLFARDHKHPTEEEVRRWEEANAQLRDREPPPNFEKIFGYPDPREAGPPDTDLIKRRAEDRRPRRRLYRGPVVDD